ncbi:MAG: galactokinase [Bacteroidetes bacterium]|nr:galactokinase [Bacteroidota bacterium]
MVKSIFEANFRQAPRIFIAPGRVNLMGEHTDYNQGFVMPAAIDKHFTFAVAQNNSEKFNLLAHDLNDQKLFSKNELKAGSRWENYLMGVINGFLKREKTISGVDTVFSSNIPSGAGLSSSAALCSGFGFALNEIFECGFTKLELALIAQEAEHQFAGTRCGIMDMYASLFSRAGTVMLLDCRSNQQEYKLAHFDNYHLVLIDTKVKHSLATSAYNKRREACEEGVQIIKKTQPEVNSLRDVTDKILKASKSNLNDEVYKRCHYVVEEIKRTQEAALLLNANNYVAFGKLMYDTHSGLSKEFEVSCEESDWLVTWAKENKIAGARQMGGGFGGCTLNLIEKEKLQSFEEITRQKYFGAFKKEPDFYPVKLTNGVHEVILIG